MRIGVTFPQTEIGSDPVAVRDWAQAAEDLGFDHIVAFDHVLGASTANRPSIRGGRQHRGLTGIQLREGIRIALVDHHQESLSACLDQRLGPASSGIAGGFLPHPSRHVDRVRQEVEQVQAIDAAESDQRGRIGIDLERLHLQLSAGGVVLSQSDLERGNLGRDTAFRLPENRHLEPTAQVDEVSQRQARQLRRLT